MKPVIRVFTVLAFLVFGALIFASAASSADDQGSSLAGKADGALDGDERSKSIHFEDDVIEGMNHNPFDSVENIANDDGRNHGHLYHRKANFRREMKATAEEAGYSQ